MLNTHIASKTPTPPYRPTGDELGLQHAHTPGARIMNGLVRKTSLISCGMKTECFQAVVPSGWQKTRGVVVETEKQRWLRQPSPFLHLVEPNNTSSESIDIIIVASKHGVGRNSTGKTLLPLLQPLPLHPNSTLPGQRLLQKKKKNERWTPPSVTCCGLRMA